MEVTATRKRASEAGKTRRIGIGLAMSVYREARMRAQGMVAPLGALNRAVLDSGAPTLESKAMQGRATHMRETGIAPSTDVQAMSLELVAIGFHGGLLDFLVGACQEVLGSGGVTAHVEFVGLLSGVDAAHGLID